MRSIHKKCSFNSLNAVIQKNVFNSQKVFIRFTENCHSRKCVQFTKIVYSQKVFIQFTENCHSRKCVQFTKNVHLQKVFIHKKCSFAKSVHSQKVFILTRAKVQNNDVTHLFSLTACIFWTFGIPLSAFVRSLAQKTCS